MAFANEYISAADIEKYGIKEFDDKNHKAHYEPSWTVDHERDIYLRYVCNEREEFANRHTYAFYWKGTMLMVEVDIDGGGVRNGAQWRHYTMRRLEIPENLKAHEAEIIADLKDAFVAYKKSGVLSNCTTHTATFGF